MHSCKHISHRLPENMQIPLNKAHSSHYFALRRPPFEDSVKKALVRAVTEQSTRRARGVQVTSGGTSPSSRLFGKLRAPASRDRLARPARASGFFNDPFFAAANPFVIKFPRKARVREDTGGLGARAGAELGSCKGTGPSIDANFPAVFARNRLALTPARFGN